MIILVGSNKGGVGKSTTVINLTLSLSKYFDDVLVLDADRQSTVSRWGDDRESSGVKPYIQVLQKYDNLKPSLDELKNKYDLIIVDVAGRNSREMLSAMLIADLMICPLQSSQADLDTTLELQGQIIRASDLNVNLKVFVYQTLASTNPKVKDKERDDFLKYLSVYPELKVLDSINYFRKAYRDSISEGKSVIEMDNDDAKNEVVSLSNEVLKILNIKY